MTNYIIDSDVFIRSKNTYYGFDFCPAFWQWLVENNNAGKIASIEKVLNEINKKNDQLTVWANNRGDKFFLKPNSAVYSAHNSVSDWAEEQDYTMSAVSNFLLKADSWLIAHALADKCCVVTNESSGHNRHKVKIPDSCKGLGIDCMSPFEMLRREQARFVLEPKGKLV